MNRTLGLALALVLLVGCGARSVGSTMPGASKYVPSAAPPGAQRWQQFCADGYSNGDIAKAGRDGWELIGVTTKSEWQEYRYCFKRPM
jgi:hypothetical protein